MQLVKVCQVKLKLNNMIVDKSFEEFLPNKHATYFKVLNKTSKNKITKNEVINQIKKVFDPEIPINLYDLGLIYSIVIEDNNVKIKMTLTNPNCPVAGEMPKKVGVSVEKLDNLQSISVILKWEPKWTKEMMSEDAKLALDIF